MSTSYTFVLTSIESLDKAIKSHDLSLLNNPKIKKAPKEVQAEVQAILSETIDQRINAAYGYALGFIIMALGKAEVFNPSEFECLHSECMDGIGIFDWLRNPVPPCGLPPQIDFDFISHLPLAEIKKLFSAWENEDLSNYDPDMKDMIIALLDIFKIAIKKKRDLISSQS